MPWLPPMKKNTLSEGNHATDSTVARMLNAPIFAPEISVQLLIWLCQGKYAHTQTSFRSIA
jgi:hypothetical protein